MKRKIFSKLKALQPVYQDNRVTIFHGDSLEILKQMPSRSVSLILTDPPYHITKKKNILNDKNFDSNAEYLNWLAQYSKEWQRILKKNGSFFCFCDARLAAKIELRLEQDFNILSRIVWTKPNSPGFDGWKGKVKKEALRQFYPQSERIIFGCHKQQNLGFNLKEKRLEAGLSQKELAELIGAYGRVNRGGTISNWEKGRSIPSRKQYVRLATALKGYDVSLTKYTDYSQAYDATIRFFRVTREQQFTDVWDFPSVRPYKGKHPAEKPLDLLEHAITATTRSKDIVLDCFAGSGNTAKAALNLGRRAVILELDAQYTQRMTQTFKTQRQGKNE